MGGSVAGLVSELEGWVSKEIGVLVLGWVAKLVASPLDTTAALLIQIQIQITNGRHTQREIYKKISFRANGEQKGKEVLSRETHNQDIPEDSSIYRPHQLSDVRQVQYLVLRQNIA
jgi:hypothetical protein